MKIEPAQNRVRPAWDRLAPLAFGKLLFSKMLGKMAPYTGTIDARVLELRSGYAKVEMRDRRAVRQHLQSVHAIALANLAELTGNLSFMYGLRDDARLIVSGMSIDYLKKARGTLTAECHTPVPATNARAEHELEVPITDPKGDVVARARLRVLVGPVRVR